MSGSSTFFARPIFPAKICRPSSFAQFSGLMSYIVGQIASIFSHILQFFPKLRKKRQNLHKNPYLMSYAPDELSATYPTVEIKQFRFLNIKNEFKNSS